MKEKVTLEDLQKISTISILMSLTSRLVMLQPCYHSHGEWEQWLPSQEGLIKIKPIDFISGMYFSMQPADKNDFHLNFIELIVKRALYRGSAHYLKGILEDIYNLAACINKLNVFHKVWVKEKNLINNQFITSEIEYLVKVSRSIYDLLQEIIVSTWSHVKFVTTEIGHKNLTKSLQKMVFIRTMSFSLASEIAERYALPAVIAEFYCRNGIFFNWLKIFRDKIIHGGNNADYIFHDK